MRKVRCGGAAALLLLGVLLGLPLVTLAKESGQAFELIERGRYLTTAADCESCHDDPVTRAAFAGGRPIETPFGDVVASNITPDRDTGIGAWSDAQFDAALRRGETPDHRRLYPAMPYPYYTKMTAADVLAIRAYLSTITPVQHAVHADQLPFPFSLRISMRVWDALYFKPGEFMADPGKSSSWNRGAYLVEALGHCQACHTPKTKLGGDKTSEAYRGYTIQGWVAPDISQAADTGLARWTLQDIVDYLKTGHNRLVAASGPMAEEVHYSSTHLNAADLTAIAAYLRALPGAAPTVQPMAATDPVMIAGRAIYEDACSACHNKNGTGSAFLFPNLAASTAVAASEPDTLVRVVLIGAQSVATDQEPTAAAMPAFGWQLNDAQIAAVTTYIRNSWGHAAPAVSERMVKTARSKLTVPKTAG